MTGALSGPPEAEMEVTRIYVGCNYVLKPLAPWQSYISLLLKCCYFCWF